MGIPNLTTSTPPEIPPTAQRNHEISGRDSSDGSGLRQRSSGMAQKTQHTQHTQRTARGPENASTEHRAARHRDVRLFRFLFAILIVRPALSTLVAAVKAAGLVETLPGTGPFTVF